MPLLRTPGTRPRSVLIAPNETVILTAQLNGLLIDIREVLVNEPIGRAFCYEWRCHKQFSRTIWLSIPGPDNKVSRIYSYTDKYLPISEYYRPPLPPIAPLLAYVHNPETPPALTCVLWNRTEEAIQVADSRIIVSAPALDYRRELDLPGGLALPAAVAPGAHTDWRIPWNSIMDLIPPADLARITASGGELDLAWKTGEHVSPPLPILLGWQGAAKQE
jgi:hypothetical protein